MEEKRDLAVRRRVRGWKANLLRRHRLVERVRVDDAVIVAATLGIRTAPDVWHGHKRDDRIASGEAKGVLRALTGHNLGLPR